MRTDSDGGSQRTETLDYIQSMLGQIRQMAEAEKCEMLAYLVEMAYVEASDVIASERPRKTRPRALSVSK